MDTNALSVELSQFLASNTTLEDRLALSATLKFLASKNTNLEDRLAHSAFLEARPTYSKPTHFVSDIEQRLALLGEIRQEFEKHNLESDCTAELWSALMVVPLEQLRSLRDHCWNDFGGLVLLLDSAASRIPILLKVCMLPY